MTTLLAFLFVLGVLIFVHELGHFLAARRVGVRVLTFSLGFGPKIVKFVRGDTEYCISAVPLGGYVKMAGENPEDPRSGKPDEFLSKTKWERFQILIMGPVMNILLSVIVLAVVLAQGAEVPAFQDQVPVVGGVVSSSPAEGVGIRRGDRILTVAGSGVDTWQDVYIAIGTRPNQNVPITLERDGQRVALSVQTQSQKGVEVGEIGLLPDTHPVIVALVPGDPAEKAGLMARDVVKAVNGTRVLLGSDLIARISKNGGQPIDMTISRNGADRQIAVTPEQRGDRGMIGATIGEQTKSFTPTPIEAAKLSVERNIEMSGLIFRTLGGLFTGQTSVKQLQGPVGIAQLSGESAQAGWLPLLSVMAMISLNLGLLNLMPVPMLDGGHILIMGLEGLARRDFSMQVKEKMLFAGLFVLMLLMVTVIYNDLTRISWIEHLMFWRN